MPQSIMRLSYFVTTNLSEINLQRPKEFMKFSEGKIVILPGVT